MTLGELMDHMNQAEALSKRINYQTQRMLQYPADHPTNLRLREHISSLMDEYNTLRNIEIK